MKLLLTIILSFMLLGAAGDNHDYNITVLTDGHGKTSVSLSPWQRGSYKISNWSCSVFKAGDPDTLYYYGWADGSTVTETSPIYGCTFKDPIISITGKPYTFYDINLVTYE